ncbi:serine-enriched protein [Chironomus tepperi]|uniref:serine-enriched protein n=1 Tax=Chironomus tepperi TaxID=113505 RepID=UPI00391F3AB9
MGTMQKIHAPAVCDKVLAGVPQLLDDFHKMIDDQETADVVFLLGREEERIYAHRLILMARCKSFQVTASSNKARGDICRIPGSTVLPPSSPGTPTLIRLPHIRAEDFRQFITYVYTAKIILHDSKVFQIMIIANDLGLNDLKTACEDHVIATMSVDNACCFLTNALEIQEKVGGKCTDSFVDRCIAFIGENANECTKTNGFLKLSKDAIVKIISSDFLCLEEENVFRAVLEWSKSQAGVTQPLPHWNEEERQRVCKYLSPIIHHVRLLLIDSQVFAEEIEPTGAIPMELVLERYRFAALQSNKLPGMPPIQSVSTEFDKRLQPRLSLNLFPGSNILRNDKMHLQTTLNNWYGNPKQTWRLVYRASTHGYTAAAFHRLCDGIAPLMVIVLGYRGEISGGFTDVAFTKTNRKGGYLHGERCFLFALSSPQANFQVAKYDIVKKPYSICYYKECGPIFGAGADLLIANNCNVNTDSYSNLPHSYDGPSASYTSLFGDYNFMINDYEVFTLG